MAKYYITCSVAYRAQAYDNESYPDMQREPWLHTRLVSIHKPAEGDKPAQTKWYAVVYVWDTREVVQWIESTGMGKYRKYEHAIDNGKPLKDPKGLLPGWARTKLCGKMSPDHISMNGPYEMQDK